MEDKIEVHDLFTAKISVGRSENEKKYPWYMWHDFEVEIDWKENRGTIVDHATLQIRWLRESLAKLQTEALLEKDYEKRQELTSKIYGMKSRICLLEGIKYLVWQRDWDSSEILKDHDEAFNAPDSLTK